MAITKWANDLVMDAALDYISSCTIMAVGSGTTNPADYTAAFTTTKLADVVLSGADFTKANGDSSGRKVTIAQKTGVTVDSTGDATYVALGISGSTTLVYITTCTTQTLTATNTMTFNSWKIEIADPT